MARVFKQRYKRDGKVRYLRKWYIEYRDADGNRKRVPGYTDKRATEYEAQRLERQADRQRAGLVDRCVDDVRKPIAQHIDDWRDVSIAEGNTERYADQCAQRVRRVFDGCGFRRWGEISASRVTTYLAGLRKPPRDKGGLSARTSNHYLRVCKTFCRWMVRDRRAPDSPIAHLDGMNVRADIRHARRPLAVDELIELLRSAEFGPQRYGIDGPDRAIVYRVACETGLRANEMRTLTVGSFDLEGDLPTVTVKAAYSKHRREDVLPIRRSLADRLRVYFSGRTPSATAFRMPYRTNTARMLRADLDAARTAWIEDAKTQAERRAREQSDFLAYRNHDGRVADFHALRHTFITALARGGVAPKVAQELARHSTITLTMDYYTHTAIGELSTALDALPNIDADDGRAQQLG